MKAAKVAVALTDLLLASLLIYRVVILPYEQNIMKKRIDGELDALDAVTKQASGNIRASATVRTNIKAIRRAIDVSSTDIDLYMELAAHYRFQGRHRDAILAYKEALKYDRRPEIFLNLAESQLAAKDVNGAIESYGWAVAFAPEETNWIPDYLIAAASSRSAQLAQQLAARVPDPQ